MAEVTFQGAMVQNFNAEAPIYFTQMHNLLKSKFADFDTWPFCKT